MQSKTPFYTVTVGKKRNITGFITDFYLEDCQEEDDLLELTLTDSRFDFANDKDLQIGKQIKVQFGYLKGRASRVWYFEISRRKPDFSSLMSFKITGTGVSYAMKKDTKVETNANKTVGQIADKMAKNYGLKFQAETLAPVRVKYSVQGSLSDWDYLNSLLNRTPGGPYQVTTKNKTLKIAKIDLKKKPLFRLSLGPGGNLASFTPNEKENNKSGARKEVSSQTIDPLTGQTIKAEANKSKSTGEPLGLGLLMGREGAGIESIGSISPKAILNTTESLTGLKIQNPASTPEAQKALVENREVKASLKDLVADFQLNEGNPNLESGILCTVSGVGKVYSGNYRIVKVSHRITAGGGLATFGTLNRNAIGSPLTTQAPGASNTGRAASDSGKDIPVYTTDGKLK